MCNTEANRASNNVQPFQDGLVSKRVSKECADELFSDQLPVVVSTEQQQVYSDTIVGNFLLKLLYKGS